jgi:tetratricopeptide (TPR) repeat protein
MPRYYIHIANATEKLPAHTYVFAIDGEEVKHSVQHVVDEFCKDYSKKYNINIIADSAADECITNQNGDEIRENSLITSALEDRDDVFVKVKVHPTVNEAYKKAEPNSKVFNKADLDRLRAQQNANNPNHISSNNMSQLTQLMGGVNSDNYASELQKARDFRLQGKIKSSREIYLTVLNSAQSNLQNNLPERNVIIQICNQELGLIALQNKHYSKAKTYFSVATDLAEKAYNKLSPADQQLQLADIALLFSLLGQCYFGLKDYDSAEEIFEKTVNLLKANLNSNDKSNPVVIALQDNEVWLARTLYSGGDNHARNRAISIYERIVAQNEQHIAALTFYAKIALDLGRGRDAIPYFLRALITIQANNKNPAAKIDSGLKDAVCGALAQVCGSEEGCKGLIAELHSAANNNSVLNFLAQTLKDYSAIDSALKLYETALNSSTSTQAERINTVLSYVHTLEVAYKYSEAFSAVKIFLKNNSTLKIANYSVANFYNAIKTVNDIADNRLKQGTAPGCAAYSPIPPIFDEGFCQVLGNTSINPRTGQVVQRKDNKSPDKPYNPDELNVLALLFTCVKILYCLGALQVIPELVSQLEPLRLDRELHLTLIRNEHAYYSTISQLARKIPFPIPVLTAESKHSSNDKVIYVVGDSHCLSSAWQGLTINSAEYVLYPKLVTGTKCWHLRPDCKFYTHANYLAALASIPANSSVIFVFGEIDCREGLIVAVEKCKYERIEQGIELATDVYVKELENITKAKKLKSFVHPIVPVLDITRPVVKQFNAILVEKVKKSAQAGSGIQYLDFFEDLLTGESHEQFNLNQYGLDGTHMSPSYVPLLERELNKVWK